MDGIGHNILSRVQNLMKIGKELPTYNRPTTDLLTNTKNTDGKTDYKV